MRHAALVLGVAATIASWYLLDDVGVLELAPWSAYVISPWLVVARAATPLRPAARAAALAVPVAMSAVAYPRVDDTSTAAIGVVLLPVYEWVAVGIVVFLDAVLYRPSTSPWK